MSSSHPPKLRGLIRDLRRHNDRSPHIRGLPPKRILEIFKLNVRSELMASPVSAVSRRERQLEAFKEKDPDIAAAKETIIESINAGSSRNIQIEIAKVRTLPPSQKKAVIDEIRRRTKSAPLNFAIASLTVHPLSIGSGEYVPVLEIDPQFLGVPKIEIPDALLAGVLEKGRCEFIQAQGVSEQKGGLKSLINIMLEGEISRGFYGALTNYEYSEMSAGKHGPFFVLIDTTSYPDLITYSGSRRSYHIPEGLHTAYLVPFQKHKDAIINAITNGVRSGLLTFEDGIKLLSKLLRFAEFINAPQHVFSRMGLFAATQVNKATNLLCGAIEAQEAGRPYNEPLDLFSEKI